jgi:hypothetical protein
MPDIARFDNPFTVTTPEGMSAEDAVSLFVDVFTDFPKVRDPGHMFLHGPRGSGKSMMFRYLQPDCQCLRDNCTVDQLSFFSIYLPVKSLYLQLPEFQRLEGRHAAVIINEHFMVMHFSEIILTAFMTFAVSETPENLKPAQQLVKDAFYPLLTHCGWKGLAKDVETFQTVKECFKEMHHVSLDIYYEVAQYLKRLSFAQDIIPYDNALCGYLDFLFPLLKALRGLPFMPDGPIYLLIDDADQLSELQTMILNSWVSTRTMMQVSLKISTQHQYKTYHTVTGNSIDTPHDYAEVNISTVYTNSIKGKYMDRVREIVRKRLSKFGIDSEPDKFFPPDTKQEQLIEEISKKLREAWKEGEGRGYRASDDVVRYARPDYIKTLSGKSKSSSTYSYAGFPQLVHISSGIIRFFLDAASQMYTDTKTADLESPVLFIPPETQSRVVRMDADKFLFDELEKIAQDRHAPAEAKLRKLANLIQALGGVFRAFLLSDRAERRVFSIAFSDTPSDEVLEVLKLGVRYGYFHESTLGRKDSVTGGRTRLYILSRRLAPQFTLDPTGFVGYWFVTNDVVERAMKHPNAILRKARSSAGSGDMITGQLPLFDHLD